MARRLRAVSRHRHVSRAWFWRDWPAPLRDRDPSALDEARRHGGAEVLRQQYLQWIAEAQWQAARTEARAAGRDRRRRSAVHGRRGERRGVGASERILARRVAGRAAGRVQRDRPGLGAADLQLGAIADTGLRVDSAARAHEWPRSTTGIGSIISSGLYPHVRPAAGRASRSSIPPDEAEQISPGRGDFSDSSSRPAPASSARISASCRISCARRSRAWTSPGCKVLRWERAWHLPGQPFVDPVGLPAGVGGDDRHPRHRAARRLVGRGARRRTAPRSSSYRPCARPA